MRIISAISGTPSLSKEEVDSFLERKLNLQIGTIDEEGDPNIQPVWFDYDKDREKFIIITPKIAKKVQNLRNKPNVYFSIDDENFPYKGVKGKGIVTIIEDPKRTVPLGEKINMKYLATLDHPIPKMILDSEKRGITWLSKLVQNSFLLGILLKCNDPVKIFFLFEKMIVHLSLLKHQ